MQLLGKHGVCVFYKLSGQTAEFPSTVFFWRIFKRIRISLREAPIISSNPFVGLSFRLSVRPSASRHVSARLPLKRFPWNLILGTCIKTYRENQNFIKIGQKYRVDYMKTSLCSVVDDMKALLCNIRYFYIVDNVLSSTAHRLLLWISIATMIV